LVGTQNIRNNQSRVGGLDHIVQSGTILEAVDNQPWSGEANVHVSIVNWVKSQDRKLLPKKRRLWFKVPTPAGAKKTRQPGSGPAAKDYELDVKDCAILNSALSCLIDVSAAKVLDCNTDPQRVFQGVTPGHKGFVLDHAQRSWLVGLDRRSRAVIFPYLVGDEILEGRGAPVRFVIDFQQREMFEAKEFAQVFDHVQFVVLPDRRARSEKGKDNAGKMRPHHRQFLERWWKLSWDRAEMIASFSKLHGRYIVCSRVTKRPIFMFVSTAIRPGDALQVFSFDDDYSFGILQSNPHWQWFFTKCSKLKSDFRYTPDSVFDTFPWPQSPTAKQIETVAKAGREVRRKRSAALTKIPGGLRAVYRTLELPGKDPLKDAHAALDAAVLDAYGFDPDGDLLAQLLDLNQTVAQRIEADEQVTAPGIPTSFRHTERLVSDDCVKPD
jgi:hypothetical protein